MKKSLLVCIVALLVFPSCSTFLPTAPSLEGILYPVGGEVWAVGSTETIQWTGNSGWKVEVRVVEYPESPSKNYTIIGGGSNPGSMPWKVGTNPYYGPDVVAVGQGTYIIEICNLKAQGVKAYKHCEQSGPITIQE